MPDWWIGSLMCAQAPGGALTRLPHLLITHWPSLLALIGFAVTTAVTVRVARRTMWRRHAADAIWLEITPPVTATPAATVVLWRLLTTLLAAPSLFARRPARLVWEVQATPEMMRVGLWVPPGINPVAVARAVGRAWPGARTEQARVPMIAAGRPVVCRELVAGADWAALADDVRPARSARWEQAQVEDDPLRAVYDGLAAAGRTGGGLLQVIVARAPGRRLAGLRRVINTPHRATRLRGAGPRLAALTADALLAVVRAVLDTFTSGPSSGRRGPNTSSPYASDLARQARDKLADSPHQVVTIRVVGTGPTVAAASAAASEVASGYAAVGHHLRWRRLRRPVATVNDRWAAPARMAFASVRETAALAGLPAEPSAYGLPPAGSRRRPPGRDVFLAGVHRPGSSPAADNTAAAPPPTVPATSPPPEMWSTP
jgi:hypothetical protein